jgi:hypothetical protein
MTVKRVVLAGWGESTNARAIVDGRDGERHEVEVMMPFGISARPMAGGEAIAIPVQGSDDHLVVVGFTGGAGRPEAAEGSVVLWSAVSGHKITLGADGSTRLDFGDGKSFLFAGGKIVTDMDIETSGDVKAGGVSLRDHLHGGVMPGGGQTSEPI